MRLHLPRQGGSAAPATISTCVSSETHVCYYVPLHFCPERLVVLCVTIGRVRALITHSNFYSLRGNVNEKRCRLQSVYNSHMIYHALFRANHFNFISLTSNAPYIIEHLPIARKIKTKQVEQLHKLTSAVPARRGEREGCSRSTQYSQSLQSYLIIPRLHTPRCNCCSINWLTLFATTPGLGTLWWIGGVLIPPPPKTAKKRPKSHYEILTANIHSSTESDMARSLILRKLETYTVTKVLEFTAVTSIDVLESTQLGRINCSRGWLSFMK